MKVTSFHSFSVQRRGQGERACVTVGLEPENELERAIIRLSRSSAKREIFLSTSGNMEIQITMPRGKF